MHVAQISFFRDPGRRCGERLLADWPSLGDTADAVAAAGQRVTVLQSASRDEVIVRRGVEFRFVDAGGALPHRRRARVSAAIRELAPDVAHIHGLGFPGEVTSLARAAPGLPIILQDHAGAMPRPWRVRAWRRGFAAATGVAFTGVAQGERFRARGMLDGHTALFDIPESSSHFVPGDRAAARLATGLTGDPCVLWVGRLNANKDPLTVLEGVSRAARELPGLRLWCAYGDATLLPDVQRAIERDAVLRGRVQLLGAVPHAHVEPLMRAADVFVYGSRAEGSGYALIEALACGLPAAVTDIPAFRALLGGGGAGRLWPCGAPDELARALIGLHALPREPLRAAVRAHFDREVSFAAVGRKWVDAYRRVIELRDGAR